MKSNLIKFFIYSFVSIALIGCGDSQKSTGNSQDQKAISLGFKNAKEMSEIQSYGDFPRKADFEDVFFRTPSYCFSSDDFYRKNCQGKQIIWMARYQDGMSRVEPFGTKKKVDIQWTSLPNIKINSGDIFLFKGIAGNLNLFHPDVNKASFIKVISSEKASELNAEASGYTQSALQRELDRYEENRKADKADFMLVCNQDRGSTKGNFASFAKSGNDIARFTDYQFDNSNLISSFNEYELFKVQSEKPDKYYQYKVSSSFNSSESSGKLIDSIRVERDTLTVSIVRYSTCFGGPNFRPYSCLSSDDYSCKFAEPSTYDTILDNNKKNKADLINAQEAAKNKEEEAKKNALEEQRKRNKI